MCQTPIIVIFFSNLLFLNKKRIKVLKVKVKLPKKDKCLKKLLEFFLHIKKNSRTKNRTVQNAKKFRGGRKK